MTHTQLTATELKNIGFETEIFTSETVIVSLTSRKVSKMEVETALNQIFDSIEFKLQSTNNGVMVTI